MSNVNGTVTGNATLTKAQKAAAARAAKAAAKAEAARITVGDKTPTQVETVVYDISQAASSIAAHAGTIWTAKLAIGQAVNAALTGGVKLTALQEELGKLPALDLVRVRDVISFDNKASGLSKLGLIARVLGAGLTSPDKKHHVTPAQVEVWGLSTEDACRLSRYVMAGEKLKDGVTDTKTGSAVVKVSTLAKYCANKDGGAAAVRDYITSKKPAGPAGSKTATVALDGDIKKRLIAAAETAGMTVSELLATLLK